MKGKEMAIGFVLTALAAWMGGWLLYHNNEHSAVEDEVALQVERLAAHRLEHEEEVDDLEVRVREVEKGVRSLELDLELIKTHMGYTNQVLDRILYRLENGGGTVYRHPMPTEEDEDENGG